MPKTPSQPEGTNWARVMREAAQGIAIPHSAADGPYDPNDAAAVAAYWDGATTKRGRPLLPGQIDRRKKPNR